MIRRRIRQASLSCGLLLMILHAATPSGALDLSNHALVYLEDFDGETSFPTLPEVNLLSIGANSSIGVDGNNNPFAAPFISGDAVVGSIHSEVPTALQNVHVPATFSNSLAIRATFNSFSLGMAPADGSASTGVVAVFGPLMGVTPTAVVDAGLGISRSFGNTTGFVILNYNEPGVAPAFTFLAFDPLDPSDAAAISAVLSGTPFTVDLAFDKTTLIATASVDIAGFGEFVAPPLDVSGIAGITSSTPLAATNLFLSENFGLDVDVNMEDISVFFPPPPVPTDSFNIDIGNEYGPPANSFAAFGLAGPWNEIDIGTTALVNTLGILTSTDIFVSGAFGSSSNTPTNDAQLLLNDHFSTSDPVWQIDIIGLVPGFYDVLLYAPTNGIVQTGELTVNGIELPNLPGDLAGELIAGTSVGFVTAFAVGGVIEILGSADPVFKGLAGIQLIPTPEPSQPLALAMGVLAISIAARKRRCTAEAH